MSEPVSYVLAAILAAVSGFVGAVLTSHMARRNKEDELEIRKNEIEQEAAKIAAETLALASAEWQKLYTGLQADFMRNAQRIDRMGAELGKLKVHIEVLENQVKLQEDTIRYLWDGIGVLSAQLKKLGHEPDWKPDLRFRGENGNEFVFFDEE